MPEMSDAGDADEAHTCAVCGAAAVQKCSACRDVFYCSKNHQKQDWGSHKIVCRPFQVKTSPEMGKFLVATKSFKPGDVILTEYPLVVGPEQITHPVCLGCYAAVDGSYKCSNCNWPMCSPQCESLQVHEPECRIIQKTSLPIDITDFDSVHHMYEPVTVLRCLLLKKRNPQKWQHLMEMEDHFQERYGTDLYKENQNRVVGFLRNYVGLVEFSEKEIDFSEETIHRVCGILDTNNVEIRLPTSQIQAVYPTAYLLEHNCIPNTRFVFNDKFQLTVLAALPIEKGEHITTMYTNTCWGTAARRDHLKHHRHFLCRCPRCLDPTEMGTNFSTLKCQKCQGNVLPIDPTVETTEWYCEKCGDKLDSEYVNDLILKIGEEMEKIQQVSSTISTLEEFLQKQSKTLHPNHYHNFFLKQTLMQLYGRQDGYQLFDLTQEQLKRKEKLCRELISLGYRIDPGMAQIQGYIGSAYFELHTPILELARKCFQEQTITREELTARAEESRQCLTNAIHVLRYESASLPEGQMAVAAKEALIEYDAWLKKIGSCPAK